MRKAFLKILYYRHFLFSKIGEQAYRNLRDRFAVLVDKIMKVLMKFHELFLMSINQ